MTEPAGTEERGQTAEVKLASLPCGCPWDGNGCRGHAIPLDPSDDDKRFEIRSEAVEDFFTRLSKLASEKDIAANGANKPGHRRSLHAVTLTMNEIMLEMATMQLEECPELDPAATSEGQGGCCIIEGPRHEEGE